MPPRQIDHGYDRGVLRVVVGEASEDEVVEIGGQKVRTASLARELMRGLIGAAPSLEIEKGPHAGAKRSLAPPESRLVLGRGDEAGWILDDEDLSRAHAEVRRGWDGIWIRDLGSKNGTKVDGRVIEGDVLLRDGAVVELGGVALRFRDPAEKHLGGPEAEPVVKPAPAPAAAVPVRSPLVFYLACGICLLAVAGLVALALGA